MFEFFFCELVLLAWKKVWNFDLQSGFCYLRWFCIFNLLWVYNVVQIAISFLVWVETSVARELMLLRGLKVWDCGWGHKAETYRQSWLFLRERRLLADHLSFVQHVLADKVRRVSVILIYVAARILREKLQRGVYWNFRLITHDWVSSWVTWCWSYSLCR